MNRILIAILGLSLYQVSHATTLWQDSTTVITNRFARAAVSVAKSDQMSRFARAVSVVRNNQIPRFAEARLLDLNADALKHYLEQAPLEGDSSPVSLTLPLPEGRYANYLVFQSPIMPATLAAKFPSIQTYHAVDSTNPLNTARLDLTPEGFHALLMHDGREIFIDPIGNYNQYQSYYKSDYIDSKRKDGHQPLACGADDQMAVAQRGGSLQSRLSFGSSITTYRLAMAATGEFTQFHGGTKAKALAAIVTGLNRINQVYGKDLAVKLELVADNDKIIFEDPATDPFTNGLLIYQVSGAISSRISSANYDVGHVVGGSGSGGSAILAGVCNSSKASGQTSISNPINDPFFIDFVAHELGHQFGSNHSFNGASGSCNGNRASSHAFEPGSGSTIMGYAGICGSENLQTNSDAYFHNDSIHQIKAHLASAGCGTPSGVNNALPVVNAGVDGAIPAQTPFILTGTASDSDNDALTYTWEQLDKGPSTNSKIYTDDGQRPLFRSFSPTSSPSRSFPKNSDVLSGTSSYGEMLPTTTRDLNFILTVRDGKGGVASDSRKLSVSSAGPFKVTIPDNTSWVTGAQTVTWDVAGTTATPVSCSKVDISFSTDGGQSFNTVLLANSDNDGSEVVQIPNLSTSKGRIKVQCSSQPFFAINSQDIAISGNGSGSNTVPTAVNDSFTMTQSQNINNLDVLANDSDVDAGDTLTITAVSDVNDGFIVSIAADQKSISFKHADGYSGSTLFRYTISDGSAEATTEVNVTVNVVPYVPSTVSNTSGRSSDGGSSGGGSHDWYFLFALLGLGVYRLRSNGFLKF